MYLNVFLSDMYKRTTPVFTSQAKVNQKSCVVNTLTLCLQGVVALTFFGVVNVPIDVSAHAR